MASIIVLMRGMVFASKGLLPGTVGYLLLNVVTAVVIVGSCGLFLLLLGFEVGTRSPGVPNQKRPLVPWCPHVGPVAVARCVLRRSIALLRLLPSTTWLVSWRRRLWRRL